MSTNICSRRHHINTPRLLPGVGTYRPHTTHIHAPATPRRPSVKERLQPYTTAHINPRERGHRFHDKHRIQPTLIHTTRLACPPARLCLPVNPLLPARTTTNPNKNTTITPMATDPWRAQTTQQRLPHPYLLPPHRWCYRQGDLGIEIAGMPRYLFATSWRSLGECPHHFRRQH